LQIREEGWNQRKNKLNGWYEFLTQSKKEREGKKRKKEKVISGQTMSDHHTHATWRWRGRQDESNDTTESQLQPSKWVAIAARIQLMHARHAPTAFSFFYAKTEKCL